MPASTAAPVCPARLTPASEVISVRAREASRSWTGVGATLGRVRGHGEQPRARARGRPGTRDSAVRVRCVLGSTGQGLSPANRHGKALLPGIFRLFNLWNQSKEFYWHLMYGSRVYKQHSETHHTLEWRMVPITPRSATGRT